jgi:hypothetical protein
MYREDQINKWLSREYRTIDNRPIYKLTWSDDARENRLGTFRDWDADGNFLREVTEVRSTKKYPYIHSRWIFEKLALLPPMKELPEIRQGSYEPVYVFEDRKGNYLLSNEKVIRFIIQCLEGRIIKDDPKSEEYFEELEVKELMEEIGNHPYFKTSGVTRDSVAYDKGLKITKEFKES